MNILGGHNYTYYPLDKFSDQTVNEKLEKHEHDLKRAAEASVELLRERLLKTAQAARGSTERGKRLDAALAYLVLAKHEAFSAGKTINAERADVILRSTTTLRPMSCGNWICSNVPRNATSILRYGHSMFQKRTARKAKV
ncbi:MAG: hypothetical protein NNA30_11880 [Nitrospira sp.]|nr:hypothetical protein [Nitrospira sp.]